MFLSPLFDLGEQSDRDIGRVGFGFDFPSEIVAQVLLASRAAAIGVTASTPDGHEAGSQHRALGLELFLAGLEEAANEGGMFGYFHKDGRRIFQI